MRKILLAAVGFSVLAGAAGFAIAQSDDDGHRGRRDIFQADANNDGVLTSQEFDAAREARFTRQDADHDGQLAREEMHRGGGHHRGGGTDGADANNDGNITRDEFLARPLERFNRVDANHDGVIQASELPQRGERHSDANGDHQLSRAEFAAMGASRFERMDADHDGRVTRDEADVVRPHRRHHD